MFLTPGNIIAGMNSEKCSVLYFLDLLKLLSSVLNKAFKVWKRHMSTGEQDYKLNQISVKFFDFYIFLIFFFASI